MAKVKMIHQGGGRGKQIEIDDRLVGQKVRTDLLYRCVKQQLTDRRQGTHATKTRSGVTGGAKKPWPQKHTGRARHGSRVSNLWPGGGIAFGPQPRTYSDRLPKKMRRLGLCMALSARYQEGQLAVIDQFTFERPKTKEGLKLLARFKFPPEHKVLIILSQDENVVPVTRSFSNLPHVQCLPVAGANVYDILRHESLVISQGALMELTKRVSPNAE
jgi:large subunit ribosomal protein L4